MAKNQSNSLEANGEIFDSEDFSNEITSEDYGFILGPDGDLKSVFMPTNSFVIPSTVAIILKAFGVNDPESVIVHSVH